MSHITIMLSSIFLILAGIGSILNTNLSSTMSVYTERPVDSEAYYFTPENYGIRADGVMDISEALQKAINQVKVEKTLEYCLYRKVNTS